MSELERLQQDLIKSLKEHDSDRLGVLRLLKNSVDQQIKNGVELDDVKFMAVTQSEVKKRQDAIALYEKAGATDKAAAEAAEIKILQEYLPEAMADEELTQLIDTVIKETGATALSDMGKVMAELKNRTDGRADLGQASSQVRARLNG